MRASRAPSQSYSSAWLLTEFALREGGINLPSRTPRSSGMLPLSRPNWPATSSMMGATMSVSARTGRSFIWRKVERERCRKDSESRSRPMPNAGPLSTFTRYLNQGRLSAAVNSRWRDCASSSTQDSIRQHSASLAALDAVASSRRHPAIGGRPRGPVALGQALRTRQRCSLDRWCVDVPSGHANMHLFFHDWMSDELHLAPASHRRTCKPPRCRATRRPFFAMHCLDAH